MPRISEFHGIIIEMYHNEHGPPHFHAKYGEHKAMVRFDPVEILKSRLPKRAERLVLEWASLRERDLMEAWERTRQQQSPGRIAPLD